MIETDTSVDQEDGWLIVAYFKEEPDEPIARLHANSYLPLPDEGDTVRLSKSVEGDSGEKNFKSTDDGGLYIVENISYDYTMAEFEENGSETNQIFTFAYVKVSDYGEEE